jgi:hypothetical protein
MNAHTFNVSVSRLDVEAIILFLPRLEELIPSRIWNKEPGISIQDSTATIERGEYCPVIKEFQQSLYRRGFVRDFDWQAWQPKAVRLSKDPNLLKKARMTTCIKLLTFHIRRERFYDGHLGEMLTSGHITADLPPISHPLITGVSRFWFGSETDS